MFELPVQIVKVYSEILSSLLIELFVYQTSDVIFNHDKICSAIKGRLDYCSYLALDQTVFKHCEKGKEIEKSMNQSCKNPISNYTLIIDFIVWCVQLTNNCLLL